MNEFLKIRGFKQTHKNRYTNKNVVVCQHTHTLSGIKCTKTVWEIAIDGKVVLTGTATQVKKYIISCEKDYLVNWSYYSYTGIEEGQCKMKAYNPSHAEELFYQNNPDNIINNEDDSKGFIVQSVDDVEEDK